MVSAAFKYVPQPCSSDELCLPFCIHPSSMPYRLTPSPPNVQVPEDSRGPAGEGSGPAPLPLPTLGHRGGGGGAEWPYPPAGLDPGQISIQTGGLFHDSFSLSLLAPEICTVLHNDPTAL